MRKATPPQPCRSAPRPGGNPMLMSVIEGALSAPAYPELAGKRVLITGVSSACGVDIARAFAEHRARLILQFAEASEAMQAVAEIVAPDALDVKVYGPVGSDADGVVQFAAAVDAVLRRPRCGHQPGAAGCGPARSGGRRGGRGAAGRRAAACCRSCCPRSPPTACAICYAEGLILNVATLAARRAGAAQAFATRRQERADGHDARAGPGVGRPRAIRFNAIAPQTLGPAAARACAASPTSPRWRCTWPRVAARSCRATCSRPSRIEPQVGGAGLTPVIPAWAQPSRTTRTPTSAGTGSAPAGR